VRYLVDTDWIISGLGGINAAVALLGGLAPEGLAISVISEGEIMEGAYGHADPVQAVARFRRFYETYEILPVTSAIVAEFARARSDLRRRGMLIQDLDLLIAATAIHHGLELVTRNIRHFERVLGLTLYRSSST